MDIHAKNNAILIALWVVILLLALFEGNEIYSLSEIMNDSLVLVIGLSSVLALVGMILPGFFMVFVVYDWATVNLNTRKTIIFSFIFLVIKLVIFGLFIFAEMKNFLELRDLSIGSSVVLTLSFLLKLFYEGEKKEANYLR